MLISRLLYYAASLPTILKGFRNWHAILAALPRRSLRAPLLAQLRAPALRFKAASPLDAWIIKETCLDDDYELGCLKPDSLRAIIDIGAGIGEFSLYAASRCPQSTVYAYEPLPASYALLCENITLNAIRNIHPFPCAIYGSRGERTIISHGNKAAQTHTATDGEAAHPEAIAVSGMTLREIFSEHALEACDLLKIDCEGAEYEILFAAGGEILGKVRHIALEYHDGVTAYSHEDLARYLRQHGFAVRLRPNRAHRHLGMLFASKNREEEAS